jgi:hypothetical protein
MNKTLDGGLMTHKVMVAFILMVLYSNGKDHKFNFSMSKVIRAKDS